MPSKTEIWPAWQEFKQVDKETSTDEDYIKAKRDVIAQFGETALRTAWLKVCADLVAITEDIASKGSASIPVIDASAILNNTLSDADEAKMKKVGCFAIRGVIPKDEAKQQYQNLETYLADNKGTIKGWPAETPSMLILFTSPTQIALRTHPSQLTVQAKLNTFWHDASNSCPPKPLSYSDGLRNRPPKQPFLGLGPHVDAGSLCRWADPAYRLFYEKIFSGEPERHDCYDLQLRKEVNGTMFPGVAHSTVFRSFQGWTALTRAAPGEGSLRLYPNVKTAIAYMLLRPFFNPPADESLVMNASQWTFSDSETAHFPGTFKPQSQFLSPSSHPHLRIKDCLVHIPTMEPGDTVWWHADMCHAVDAEHNGNENACVAYIAACPSTQANIEYIKGQYEDTVAGRPPKDFASSELDERTLKGYTGYENLGEEAKEALGFYL